MPKFPVKRGAGAYSQSPIPAKPPTWLQKHHTLRSADKNPAYRLNDYPDRDHPNGKDISARVFPVSERNGGYSAEVSRGRRPRHRAEGR